MRWLNAQSQPTLVWRTSAKLQKKKKASFVDEGGRGRESGEKKNGSTERRCERRKRGRFYAYLLLDSQHCFVGGKNGCKKPINAPVFTHSRCCVHESTQVRVVMVVVVGKGVEMGGGGMKPDNKQIGKTSFYRHLATYEFDFRRVPLRNEVKKKKLRSITLICILLCRRESG